MKRYLRYLYNRSKIFRNIANFFGLSFGSSTALLATGGTCPFCGAPMASCPIGILSALATGVAATGILYLFMSIWNGIKRILKLIYIWNKPKNQKI